MYSLSELWRRTYLYRQNVDGDLDKVHDLKKAKLSTEAFRRC